MTPKSQAAKLRNWRIFRLRGLWYSCSMMDPDLAANAQSAIDLQLCRLGAEEEIIRRARLLKEALEEIG